MKGQSPIFSFFLHAHFFSIIIKTIHKIITKAYSLNRNTASDTFKSLERLVRGLLLSFSKLWKVNWLLLYHYIIYDRRVVLFSWKPCCQTAKKNDIWRTWCKKRKIKIWKAQVLRSLKQILQTTGGMFTYLQSHQMDPQVNRRDLLPLLTDIMMSCQYSLSSSSWPLTAWSQTFRYFTDIWVDSSVANLVESQGNDSKILKDCPKGEHLFPGTFRYENG